MSYYFSISVGFHSLLSSYCHRSDGLCAPKYCSLVWHYIGCPSLESQSFHLRVSESELPTTHTTNYKEKETANGRTEEGTVDGSIYKHAGESKGTFSFRQLSIAQYVTHWSTKRFHKSLHDTHHKQQYISYYVYKYNNCS